MKFLLVAVYAILGYVGANCGCLKCSKHLAVLGEIPGAPGQVPIKVICRCNQGYPDVCDGVVPVQPIAVQTPVQIPDVPICIPGRKYSIQLKPFCKHACAPNCYIGSGAIYGPGAAGNPCECLENRNVYDYNECYGPVAPVKVQVPVQVPEAIGNCIPLKGLTTALDRIIIPCPAISPTGASPYGRSVCGDSYGYGSYGSDCDNSYSSRC